MTSGDILIFACFAALGILALMKWTRDHFEALLWAILGLSVFLFVDRIVTTFDPSVFTEMPWGTLFWFVRPFWSQFWPWIIPLFFIVTPLSANIRVSRTRYVGISRFGDALLYSLVTTAFFFALLSLMMYARPPFESVSFLPLLKDTIFWQSNFENSFLFWIMFEWAYLIIMLGFLMVLWSVIVRQFWFQMGVVFSGLLIFFRNTFRSARRTTHEIAHDYEDREEQMLYEDDDD